MDARGMLFELYEEPMRSLESGYMAVSCPLRASNCLHRHVQLAIDLLCKVSSRNVYSPRAIQRYFESQTTSIAVVTHFLYTSMVSTTMAKGVGERKFEEESLGARKHP